MGLGKRVKIEDQFDQKIIGVRDRLRKDFPGISISKEFVLSKMIDQFDERKMKLFRKPRSRKLTQR